MMTPTQQSIPLWNTDDTRMAPKFQPERVSLQVLRSHWERAYGEAPSLVPTIYQKHCRTPEDQLGVPVPEAQ